VDFKIVKVGELNIKEALDFFIKVFFLLKKEVSIWEYKNKSDRMVVIDRTFLKTYMELLNFELLCFVFYIFFHDLLFHSYIPI
jgi:hypothetical protein